MTDITDDISEEISFQGFEDDCKLLGNLLNGVLQSEVGPQFMEKVEKTRVLAQVDSFTRFLRYAFVLSGFVSCFCSASVVCSFFLCLRSLIFKASGNFLSYLNYMSFRGSSGVSLFFKV